MRDLYLIINKLNSHKGTKEIYYDLGIPENTSVDIDNINDIISKSNTFIDRVLLLTALLDENIDTNTMSITYKENKEIYDFIKTISKINFNLLNKTEETKDGWFYTIDDTPYEFTIKNKFEKTKKLFETKK